MNEMVFNSLPKVDHHAAMNVIGQLGHCETIDQFNHLLKTQVIPLTNSHGVFYTKLSNAREPPGMLDSVCHPSICRYSWKSFLEGVSPAEVIGSSLLDDSPLMLATEAFHHTNSQCQNCHLFKSHDCAMRLQFCTVVALCDVPKPAIALFVCRLTSIEHAYSERDLIVLQLLQATLLQTVKAIIYQQENFELKHLLDHISECSDPFAVVREDGYIIHRNQAFDQTVGQNKIYLSKHIKQYSISINKDNPVANSILSRLGNRLYEISITPFDEIENEQQSLFLIRYTRVSDKKKQWTRSLVDKGLTGRELEVAMLLSQGLAAKDIAQQLNLSYHTVRNHIKHIYEKTGVSTRTELINWEKDNY